MIDAGIEYNMSIVSMLNKLAIVAASGKPEREAEVQIATEARHRIVPLTPIITGSWASAWTVYSESDRAIVAIAPEAINPLSPERPAQYGPEVHDMGGYSRSGHKRAVLDVVMAEYSEELLDMAGEEYFVAIGIGRGSSIL